MIKNVTGYRIVAFLGFVWIVASILLFINTDAISGIQFKSKFYQLESLAKITIPIPIPIPILTFFIGGLGISYALVHMENTRKDLKKDMIKRVILFAIAVSLASLIPYFWLTLAINGFSHG